NGKPFILERAMRFSVDAHAIAQHLTGNETYIRNLLNCFDVLDRESEFVAYVSRADAIAHVPERFQKKLVSGNPFLRLGYDLPRRVARDAPSLLHVQYTAPLMCSAPVVVSVHDVSYLEHPEYFTSFRSRQLRLTVRRTLKSAASVLTPSEFSKKRILDAYGLADDKVVVLPNGVSSVFRPVPREAAQRSMGASLPPVPFILTVGDLQPRKNHLGLIAAFEDLVQAHPKLPHHLLVVGKDTWHTPAVRAAAKKSRVAERIHFTGFVDDEQLRRLYGSCDLFVYPSFYEGFGLPILEAMACGRAVACSNTSAMPEVADSAALLFDPTSRQQLVYAMRDLLLNPELRQRMERLGTQRAAMFSWSRSAARTLEVYYAVAGQSAQQPPAVRKSAVGG
ncbi:MAG TPA: glycosyltransferase family 1 protein, partial [Bryobacteraceae bacterium]|nr:glycosyltransferase family 1 protein [Bryobacteraceae bacterium]